VSDHWDWNQSEVGDEDEKGEADVERESPGGWSQDDPDGGWPSLEPTWPETGQGGYGEPAKEWDRPSYGDYGYSPREEIPADEPVADRYAGQRSRDPLARLFPGLPHGVRVTLDWIFTIAGAILIVLALKEWVVNPYRIPSSSMEPALNCAKPAAGCLGNSSDRVLACRICLDFGPPSRGDIVVFNTPRKAAADCGEGGTFVKRVIGLPGDTVREDRKGFIWIRAPGSTKFVKLKEPYVSASSRRQDVSMNSDFLDHSWSVPAGNYFFMGDNRGFSCDSRRWGSVPRSKLIGTVFFVYWPPDRIGFR
jgi:signal peptidase I